MLGKSKLLSYYRNLHFLSIDVLVGSMAVMSFAVSILGVNPNPIWWFILPCIIWSFYTIDHLIDGYKSNGKTSIQRHEFHFENRKVLLSLSIFLGLLAFVLSIFFLDNLIIILGFIIGLVVVTYFLLLRYLKNTHSLFLQKELIIALIYVAGIWLAPIVWNNQYPDNGILIIIFIFILLAWAEGIMASYFDYDNDLKEKHGSFPILFGKGNCSYFLFVLHLIIFAVTAVSLFFISNERQIIALSILTLMNLILFIIIRYPNWFQEKERYRILGESVFLLPACILFF